MTKTIIIALLLAAAVASPAAAAKFQMSPLDGPLIEVPVDRPEVGSQYQGTQPQLDEQWQSNNPRVLCERMGGTWKRRNERGWPDPHCEL